MVGSLISPQYYWIFVSYKNYLMNIYTCMYAVTLIKIWYWAEKSNRITIWYHSTPSPIKLYYSIVCL